MRGVDTEQPDGAQQAANAEGADGDAEFACVPMKGVFHQHRTKDDERSTQHAGQEHCEERAANVGLAGDVSYADKGMMGIKPVLSSKPPSPARQDPQRDPDERQIRRRVQCKASDRTDARHQHAGKSRPQNAGEIELGRVQREGGRNLFARDDGRHDRLKRRHRDRIRHADDQRQCDDHPRLHRAGCQKNDSVGHNIWID